MTDHTSNENSARRGAVDPAILKLAHALGRQAAREAFEAAESGAHERARPVGPPNQNKHSAREP